MQIHTMYSEKGCWKRTNQSQSVRMLSAVKETNKQTKLPQTIRIYIISHHKKPNMDGSRDGRFHNSESTNFTVKVATRWLQLLQASHTDTTTRGKKKTFSLCLSQKQRNTSKKSAQLWPCPFHNQSLARNKGKP